MTDDLINIDPIEMTRYEEWLDEDYEQEEEEIDYEADAEEEAISRLEEMVEKDEEEYMSINW